MICLAIESNSYNGAELNKYINALGDDILARILTDGFPKGNQYFFAPPSVARNNSNVANHLIGTVFKILHENHLNSLETLT